MGLEQPFYRAAGPNVLMLGNSEGEKELIRNLHFNNSNAPHLW